MKQHMKRYSILLEVYLFKNCVQIVLLSELEVCFQESKSQ